MPPEHTRTARPRPFELDGPPPVSLWMVPRANAGPLKRFGLNGLFAMSSAKDPKAPFHVRKPLLVALALSVVLHLAWTFWPVDEADDEESTVLQATLTEMPPPPVPQVQPAPTISEKPKPQRRIAPKRVTPRPSPPAPAVVADAPGPEVDSEPRSGDVTDARAAPDVASTPPPATAAPEVPAVSQAPTVQLPPRVDLAYKVFLGTQGFVIGNATYRFEHDGDRYRISTVGQARGLAALIVRGTGKVESRGRITEHGLRPYEFAIERGSADRREIAYFDWDAGNVVLHDGARAQLEAPAFDPLTILWQPYFSPPGKEAQTFSIATTRRVARYTLTLQGEETLRWPRGEIATERWHRRSDDGNTDAWIWLAPSLHYVPIKMRVTRTSRGTLEVLLDSIRVDDAEKFGLPAELASPEVAVEQTEQESTKTASDITYGMPGSGLPPMRAEDLHGQ